MSVAVIITNPPVDTRDSFYVPVASDGFFRDVWRPLALELNLVWVPLFYNGTTIKKCHLKEVFEELDTLEQYAKGTLNDKGQIEHMTTRIALMKKRIREISDIESLELYIG